MATKNSKWNIKYLVLVIIIVLFLIVNLTLYLKRVVKPKVDSEQAYQNYISHTNTTNKSNNMNNTKTAIRTDDDVKRYLSTLNEGNRMEYYCGKFIRSIQDKEYEKAYSVLYGDFKDNYFSNIEDFIKYVEDFYPQNFGLEYDDIERFGDLYVIRLKILDYSAKANEEPKIQRVVIRESDYNNYTVSFQVEKEENN